MTAKEYLQQAYRLDLRINSDIEEVSRLREMATSITVPVLGNKIQTSRTGDAPYVHSIEKIMMLEEKINQEIDTLVDLKEQMRDVIDGVTATDERMVLRYRYVLNMTWEQIANEMHADARTIRRWHGSALLHMKMPKNPVII